LLIVGWDGATPELTGPWMDAGLLPNLAGLRARGVSAPLRSVLHPLSPAAWTTAFTGLQPGRHGVFDFGQRRAGTYVIDPVSALDRAGSALWEIAGDCGLRSLAVNVPVTHPAQETPGCVLVPGLGAVRLDGATHPRSLAASIAREAPGYAIDANSFDHRDPAEFLAAAGAMEGARAHVAASLMRREQPDLAVVVFVATDRVQHALWKQSALPTSDGNRAGWRFAHAVRDTYRRLDDALGELMSAAPDATVVVVSDHGFGALDGDLYLNGTLEDLGLLAVSRPRSPLPPRLARWLRRLPAIIGRQPEAPALSFGDIDWARTKAYARGLFGAIWLNLRGREPLGQVEPGPGADRLLETIAERVLTLRGPDGTMLVDAVLRGDTLYGAAKPEAAPDLVVVPKDYRYMTRSGREFGPRGVLTAPPAVAHTGNHRLDGVLVAAGPGITPSASTPPQRLLDLTPTALALLGIEVPRGLDGQPMREVLGCDVGWTDELPWREPTAGPVPDADADAMRGQLRALGYLAPEG
jgi:predicted AlkP superfamily phosphohydrolase/phosphomutase